MSLGGLVASAVGYLWLLIAALSAMGVVNFPTETTQGSLIPALALIFLGRALRRRAAAQAEREIVLDMPPPPVEATPPILPDVPRAPTDPQPPVQHRPKPPPPRAEPPPAPEPIAEQVPTPATAGTPQPPPSGKTSRELIDEARERWGKKP